MKEPSIVADYELLELLLGYVIPRKDVKPIAKELLIQAGSLTEILFYDMTTIKGVGEQTEIFLSALKEYCDRCAKEDLKTNNKKLNTPEAVYKFFKYSMALGKKETFAVLHLNSNYELINYNITNNNTVNAAVVFPREVAELALKAGAVNVIIAHNHPSGNLKPSREDIDITVRILEALDTLDIRLSDHVILSKNGYVSLKSLKLM